MSPRPKRQPMIKCGNCGRDNDPDRGSKKCWFCGADLPGAGLQVRITPKGLKELRRRMAGQQPLVVIEGSA